MAGPLLAYEILTAFFLEATFLAVMLFGFNRVSKPHSHPRNRDSVDLRARTNGRPFSDSRGLNSWMHTARPRVSEMRDGPGVP